MKIVKTIFGLITIGVILVLVVIASIKMKNRTCSELQVIMHYEGENCMISQDDILQILNVKNIQTTGIEIKEINLSEITKVLAKEPFIKSIDKINFAGTKLRIEITLRQLLMHVYPSFGEQYFIDTEGYLLPYSSKVNEKMMIVNGNIANSFKTGWNIDSVASPLRSCYRIACEIIKNPFYHAQFRQFYVNNIEQIELVPSVGNQIVLLGDEQNLHDKLLKLKEISTNILPYSDDKYTHFDLRFKSRVIARKS